MIRRTPAAAPSSPCPIPSLLSALLSGLLLVLLLGLPLGVRPALAWTPGEPVDTLVEDAGTDTFWQVGTLEGLLSGLYDGVVPLPTVIEHGDLGLGTFDHLDGEMVLVDGHIWQARSDGSVTLANPKDSTPFACATFFGADATADLDGVTGMADLTARLEALMPGRNLPCAFRVRGVFTYVKTRSVPAQAKPYPPLAQVAKTQPTFEKTDVPGTLVGFYLPRSMARLNAAGFHLHFLANDRSIGGHVLDVRADHLRAEVDITPHLSADLPVTEPFRKANLEPEREKEIKAVEQ